MRYRRIIYNITSENNAAIGLMIETKLWQSYNDNKYAVIFLLSYRRSPQAGYFNEITVSKVNINFLTDLNRFFIS